MAEYRKYRNGSTRMKNWDYRSRADYFVTIRVREKNDFFGTIKNGKMILSEYGLIANERWLLLPRHFKNIELGPHIIMPDHIHGIISITQNKKEQFEEKYNMGEDSSKHELDKIRPKPNSLSSIVRSYKAAVSRLIRIHYPTFSWQPRF